jgi:cell division cycle 2-like protein
MKLPTDTEILEESEPIPAQQIQPTEMQRTAAPPRKHNPIFDGCRSVDCYQRINFIDQGTYGMVFKAKCRETGEMYALKQIKFGPETSKVGFPITALREINILLALQHPNIVRVKEMVVGSSIDKIYMVMEYCENDLKTCMKMSKQSFSTAEVSNCLSVAQRI